MNSSQNWQNFDAVPHSDLLIKVAMLPETCCGESYVCVWGYHRQFEFELTVRVGIYTSFGPSIPVYTCIYTDTRIYGLNTYDD